MLPPNSTFRVCQPYIARKWGRPVGPPSNRNTNRTLRLNNGSFEAPDVAISSRAFCSGFDIKTPVEIFSAEKVRLSPTGEIRILNSSASQIARLETESFFSSVIITGGGFYQFARGEGLSQTWVCKGEGKLFRVLEKNSRSFLISQEAQEIAEARNVACLMTTQSECSTARI